MCSVFCYSFSSKDFHQRQYYEQHHSPLLVDYAKLELEKKVRRSVCVGCPWQHSVSPVCPSLQERIVVENDHWLAVVPFW